MNKARIIGVGVATMDIYVNQKRIAKAESMLVEPQYSVTEVASNCGFSSLSSFIRMFKIVKGCTPSDFRSMYWSHN